MTSVGTRYSKTVAQSNWLHWTYLHTGTTLGRGITLYALVRKTMRGSLWGNQCVQDDSATVIYPCLNERCCDVITKPMKQSWRGDSVQSHVITKADKSMTLNRHQAIIRTFHGQVYWLIVSLDRHELTHRGRVMQLWLTEAGFQCFR